MAIATYTAIIRHRMSIIADSVIMKGRGEHTVSVTASGAAMVVISTDRVTIAAVIPIYNTGTIIDTGGIGITVVITALRLTTVRLTGHLSASGSMESASATPSLDIAIDFFD